MILSTLNEGDIFRFNTPRRKNTIYIVEGQYPLKKITTVFSEPYLNQHPNAEPIAVENKHEVTLIQKKGYNISHHITKC